MKITVNNSFIIEYSVNEPLPLRDILIDNGCLIPSPCGGKGNCGKCTVSVNGEAVKSCGYFIKCDEGDINVTVPVFFLNRQNEFEKALPFGFASGQGESKNSKKQYIFLDIGSTALEMAKADESGEITESIKCENPQCAYGADVISRIEYCRRHGQHSLQKCLLDKINEMLSLLLPGNEEEISPCGDTATVSKGSEASSTGSEASSTSSAISSVTSRIQSEKPDLLAAFSNENSDLFVTGNTVMLHSFFGEDLTKMGVYPYTPSFLEGQGRRGEAMGLNKINSVISFPCIAPFIGSDITTGIEMCPMPKTDEKFLFIDLGTNSEIALITSERLYFTSAPAGPCFEGGNIKCGSAALPGAICSFNKETGFCLIGENPAGRETCDKAAEHQSPAGICAFCNDESHKAASKNPIGICLTGLIDIISYLVKSGLVTPGGEMISKKFRLTSNIFVDREDIRSFQTAKSAIRAGIAILLKRAGVTLGSVDRLFIAGAAGENLSIDSAVTAGLIPKELERKVTKVGNSALRGLIKSAITGEMKFNDFEKEYIDLSLDEDFGKIFIENMNFE